MGLFEKKKPKPMSLWISIPMLILAIPLGLLGGAFLDTHDEKAKAIGVGAIAFAGCLFVSAISSLLKRKKLGETAEATPIEEVPNEVSPQPIINVYTERTADKGPFWRLMERLAILCTILSLMIGAVALLISVR